MISAMALGFLLGMRHALDPDHLAAIAVLNSERLTTTGAARQGFAWGLGHSLTVLVVGVAIVALGLRFPPLLAHVMEACVGIMLIVLGIDLIRRQLWRSGRGSAGGFTPSLAAGPALAEPHAHRLPQRALGIGVLHGLAGSSAITLIALGSMATPGLALLYLTLFGVGSVVGMTLLSAAFAAPLAAASSRANWVLVTTQTVAACASIVIGVLLLQQSMAAIW